MSRNSGKALWIKEKIPVYEKNNGIIWKNNEDLKVGNYVLDEYAEPTKITHINPIIIEDEYIVSFKSGEEIHCNSEHLWNVYDRSNRKENIENRKLITISTEEMAKNYTYKNGYRFLNPVHNIKQENSEIKNFEIEPYLLGLWLGDGNKNSNKITSDIKDIDEEIKILNIINKNGWIFKKQEVPNKNYGYINIEHPDDKNRKKVFTKLIRSKSLYENKNIPNEYFLGNYEQKMDLLRGLMDSDGNCNKQTAGNCFFVQKDISISNQMCHLLALLGIKYSIYESDPIDNRSKKQSHRCQVFFKSEKSNPCFYLKRKCSLLADSLDSRNYVDAIISIKKTGKKIPMRCITVSNESGCFLCGEHCTVTHNSYLSSPLMMARALLIPNTNTYIMAPSGGQAQETFGKMESLSKNQIASVLGVTSVFLEETIRQNAGTDPFVHDKNSYHVELYNGSTINTLNSVVKNIVGKLLLPS